MFFLIDSGDSSSDEEKKQRLRLERKGIKQRSNIFNLPDTKFVDYFRISKPAFKFILEKTEPSMKIGKRSTFISNQLKLATTLRFLAQGPYQLSVGNDFNLALSQPIVCAILAETLEVLERKICPMFINFEMSEQEKTEAKQHFFVKTGFPGVIGYVDGTHIKVSAPNKAEQGLYFNRKGFFSLNAMITCDHKMRMRYFDARYTVSSHDSLIWNISSAKRVLCERYNAGERNSWLLGPFRKEVLWQFSTLNMLKQGTLLKEQLEC
ncbi:putative nuclease HARBI1 isoform X2 [Anastrepha ludens]|uniref:putative nuclease HARBI1 isoform X2 n=1 Tax=Anastrepha ludens TaxID=28586 RepID=UPI0023AED36A|nr:putative nuclease HARBI1 isoform X2 [Anastrepha ludens]